jgi:hypothetical protein
VSEDWETYERPRGVPVKIILLKLLDIYGQNGSLERVQSLQTKRNKPRSSFHVHAVNTTSGRRPQTTDMTSTTEFEIYDYSNLPLDAIFKVSNIDCKNPPS